MANICNNTLEFSGDDENMKAVYALFQELKKQNEELQEGAMPEFLDHKEGYFFGLYVEDFFTIDYWTKWSPNEYVIKDIADKYQVDFTLAYAELGCGLFGKFFYDHKTKTLTDVCLTDSEMDVVSCDDNGIYWYNGEEIESPEYVYIELLDAKIKAINNIPKTTHTAGEWHAHDGQIYPQETGKTLALIPYFDKDNEEQKANCNLIAAAPMMYEALLKIQEKLSGNFTFREKLGLNEIYNEVNEAISKAKGE